MCGRYAITLPPEAMIQLFDLKAADGDLRPRFNVAPSQSIPIVRLDEAGARSLAHVRWGLHPSWMKEPPGPKSMINARSETAREKPFFRSAFKARRCLIPVNGFYEWKRENESKTPFFIHSADGAPLVFAGLWERWRDGEEAPSVETTAILTTSANRFMGPIHDRMPAILPKEAWDFWLSPKAPAEALESMLAPAPERLLAAHAVSRAVNNPKSDGPSLIAPV